MGEQSLKQEVAALTIQLAWRRYYRRKVLASNNPYRTMLNKFSKDVRNAKQNFLETRIYTRQQRAQQFYGMKVERPKRPYYSKNRCCIRNFRRWRLVDKGASDTIRTILGL